MRQTPILAAAIFLFVTMGCATNPVTGKRQFNIVSESQAAELEHRKTRMSSKNSASTTRYRPSMRP